MSSLSVKGNKAQKFSYQICIWHWFDRLATHSVSSGRDTLPQKCGWDAKQSGNNVQLLFTNDVNFEGVVAQPKIQNNIWNSKQYKREIYIEYSKQFKWNLYFYLSGQHFLGSAETAFKFKHEIKIVQQHHKVERTEGASA